MLLNQAAHIEETKRSGSGGFKESVLVAHQGAHHIASDGGIHWEQFLGISYAYNGVTHHWLELMQDTNQKMLGHRENLSETDIHNSL